VDQTAAALQTSLTAAGQPLHMECGEIALSEHTGRTIALRSDGFAESTEIKIWTHHISLPFYSEKIVNEKFDAKIYARSPPGH
jgi:hypothetical protein